MRFLSGRANAFIGIVTKEQYSDAFLKGFRRTVRFLMSRGAGSDAALEAAQAAWVRGWERLYQLHNESDVMPWVNTIAVNIYRAMLRGQSVLQPLPELCDSTGINLDALEIQRILDSCRPADRTLFEHFLQGGTTREIAQEIGVTETAIRLKLFRARQAVRSRVGNVSLRSRTSAAAVASAA